MEREATGSRRLAVSLLHLLCLTLFLADVARAERLPIRQFGIVDGLPTDAVAGVYRDSRGLLWFSTHAGLSRFDGHRFVNYDTGHGLPVDVLVEFTEDHSGNFWVATWGGGGIARFDPRAEDPGLLFAPLRLGDGTSEHSTALLADSTGRIWVGTVTGLFVRDPATGPDAPFLPVELDALPVGASGLRIRHLMEDRRGNIWITTPGAIGRRTATGEFFAYPTLPAGTEQPDHFGTLEDREGRIWISHSGGLIVSQPLDGPTVLKKSDPPSCGTGTVHDPVRLPDAPGESCRLTVEELPGPGEPRAMFEASDGHVWIQRYAEGLTEFDGTRFHIHGEADGVGGYLISGMSEDPAGNLWLASLDSGALRVARTGFTAYDRADGLGFTRRAQLAESLAGEVYVIAGPVVYPFDGERFDTLRPEVLEGLGQRHTDMSSVLQDHTGEWWFGTRRGLFSFDRAESLRNLTGTESADLFTTRNGLPGNTISCLFEDSSGDIWIGVDAPQPILRWERSTGTLHHYPGAQGSRASNRPLAFTEDLAGQVWVGFLRGVTRFREGRFEHFTRADGLVADGVVRPYADKKGRLWLVSGYSGVTRVDHPEEESPDFARRYTTAEGLATDPVFCAVDDEFGRLYFCTAKGVDRLDPETGRIRHYTRADGLSTSEVVYGMRDRGGALWFTSLRGVSRLVPRADPEDPPPPPVWVTGVHVAGVTVPVSELGEAEVSGLRLPTARNQVRIDFASPSFEVGEEIRYRYRLNDANDTWSAPTDLQSVNFANLSPGRYRFEVLALNSHGAESASPATVSFNILPPLWMRWWVLTLALLALTGLAVGAHRLRVARMVELERVRTRIATDLHDDIGASLSQIAILTEVLNRRTDLESSASRTYLSRIAESSRELVDSMADIVWAINPKRDRLSDLVQRMRRFMGDAVAGREIDYAFRGPAQERDLRLGPDMRRQLFLVFKESVNNAVRHSGCGRVEVGLSLDGTALHLEVRDDGSGFDIEEEYDGNGLESIRRRSLELGGMLTLDSRPGEGTTVRLEIPECRRHLNR